MKQPIGLTKLPIRTVDVLIGGLIEGSREIQSDETNRAQVDDSFWPDFCAFIGFGK